ncbi:FUN14 family-domain-containing protein [Glomus cerebriforme]|uniref:FUN14 family-domain-containing protein n=1 Tax=Glomus cerebriforme TaxID=658196 RepID=A0A397TAG0_9GLOM|nr:FUN14 family-domain-containing protein [Glomus cerebriforme]
MSQPSISLIGTLRGVNPSIYFLRASTHTNFGVAGTDTLLLVNSFRKNSTIAAKQIVDLVNHRFVPNSRSFLNNKLYARNSAVPISLSYGFSLSVGLAASRYLGKVIYCTVLNNRENGSKFILEEKITQTVDSTPEATLFPSQTSPSNSQTTTTKENITSSSTPSPDERHFSLFDLFNLSQISFGTSMGFASGFFVKKISKTASFLVGATFVLLQVLEHQGYIKIHWNKFEENYNKVLDLDNDGKVTTNDFKLILYKVVDFLSRNFQTDASFILGFGIGFRYG